MIKHPTLTFSAAVAAFLGFVSVAHADCAAFTANAQAAPGGAVPRLDADGKLVSIVVYGEGTFLAPTRSLIGKARSRAEMDAKRAFVEWIEGDNFSAEEETQEMMETVRVTNQEGETAGLAQEISTSLEAMRSNTGATISGLAKLDECVDTNEKFVMVELGWKPEFSTAARDAAATLPGSASAPAASVGTTMPGPAASADTATPAPATSGSLDLIKKSTIDPVEGYRIKSPLKDQF